MIANLTSVSVFGKRRLEDVVYWILAEITRITQFRKETQNNSPHILMRLQMDPQIILIRQLFVANETSRIQFLISWFR